METFSKRKQIFGLLGWIVITFIASAFGAVASIQAKEFYRQLNQPSWAPPSWLFGPVWTLLYTLMAIAVWLVWRNGGLRQNRAAIVLFLLQLAFNAVWSWLFFAWRLGGLAFADILVLWILVATTVILFWRTSRTGASLLVPYLAWVTFAAVLNVSVWQLNPSTLG